MYQFINSFPVMQADTVTDLRLSHPFDSRAFVKRFDPNSNPHALLIRLNEILKPHGAVIKGAGSLEFVCSFVAFVVTHSSMQCVGRYTPSGETDCGEVPDNRHNSIRKSLCLAHFRQMRSSPVWSGVGSFVVLPDFLAELDEQ
jgi:hypothetical protein